MCGYEFMEGYLKGLDLVEYKSMGIIRWKVARRVYHIGSYHIGSYHIGKYHIGWEDVA